MDHEAELSESASSEPCSSIRPNPFNDSDYSSRKRQRLSRSGSSRSRSVDTARASDTQDPMPLREGSAKTEAYPLPPRTPTRSPAENTPTEPTSSRVTINLRTRPLDAILSSPPSPTTPSKMVNGGEDTGTRVSVESESDALSTIPAIETPSSSPSATGSPKVELVINEEDSDFARRSPPLAIIDEDEVFIDPMDDFPYNGEDETLPNTVRRLVHFLQCEPVESEETFCRIRDWIERYLAFTSDRADSWYESYIRHREFWTIFPDIIASLSWRSRFFGSFLHRSRDGRQALSEMLCQFARLAGRFVTMDIRTLAYHAQKSDNDQDPDLASRGYLFTYSFLLRKDESSHIGRNLEIHYRWNWDEDIAMLTSSFQAEGGTVSALTKLVEGQLRLVSRNPKIIDNMSEPCRLAAKIVVDAITILEDPETHHKQYLDTAQQQITQGYEFFRVMQGGLRAIIEKHVTFLTPDAATIHMTSLTSVLRITLSSESASTRDLLDAHRRDHPDLPRKHLAKVISTEWKFSILKSLITSAQMQLRVVGVTTMCQELLNIYSNGKGNDPAQSPLLLYFADFVLQNKLVDYIVGIGSHPEIINESNNIVGFLIVTKTYNSQQTDKIWQTVMSSQDPRVVEAILRMVRRVLNLYDYQSLLYLCKKASDLPIEAFTTAMRDFCENLFQHLIAKALQEGTQYIDAPPYDLCVRLIRESSIITAQCPAGHPDIQNFAAGRFRELLGHGPGGEVRNAIYLSCIVDISSRAPTASGSICVINALLRQNMGTDLHILTTEHGLTQLVIEELESTIAGDQNSSSPSVRNSPASQARRDLLLAIILHEPGSISPELGTRLWNLLVGSDSRSPNDRNTSWQILNGAVKKSSSNNVFIATCFRDHLPKLPPDCFTLGALDFAREGVFGWLEEIRHDFIAEDRPFESPALEQLWHMILTAPPNTIDAPAINILVEVYVDHGLILSIPRAKARNIHLALVDRCLKQLAAAATRLKSFSDDTSSGSEEGMVIVVSEAQFQEQEKMFARSLAVLREFLRAYQSKPQFATPKPRSPVTVSPNAVEGEPLTVKYQSFDGDKHTEVKSLTLGKLNSAASLFASLQKATGFKNYKVYCGGKEFDPDEIEVCKSLDDLNLNGLVLVQRREDLDGSSGQVSGNKTTLELEITKHFDELWGYLSMHEMVAQEIYYFLVKFPVYDRLLRDFDSNTVSYSAIFPLGEPFKSLYAIHALREYIISQSQKGTVNEVALARAISLIVAAISNADVLERCASEELRDCLALHLIDCFVQFLKEPVLPASVSPFLNETLLKRLLELLYGAKSVVTSQNSVHLTWRSFEAILEASLHSPELWKSFKSHLSSSTLLQDLILEDPRAIIRKSVTKQIVNKCAFTPSLARVSTADFVIAFWPLVGALIPDAVHLPSQCEDTFSLCHTLFKKLAEISLDLLILDHLVERWGTLLLSHAPIENIGHPESVDPIAQGLAQLLYCAASFAKASQQTLSCRTLGPELFRKHLFPAISTEILDDNSDDDHLIVPRIPLLNSVTRHIIAETIFFLVKDDPEQYRAILRDLAQLVQYDDTIEDGPYQYELSFQFERSKAIRSHTGFVGLRNLSNTCYLNSLFTQLFMNIPFREFMLGAHVADGGASQKLLSETQSLFSYMQNSLKRFVDPVDLAGSIRTYEETHIDVSIQMDVDEFYNLLFDRWESQILAPEAKRRFRSFYGGQLVQQVKSKECPHISERLEPFSAIQCDIKGKNCLQDSLQAYVDGEIMEGDNKYKCSTCDRHVDAVKRACLKDIPDNLIFHLKRFDFNLRTLQRSKINDYFQFPPKIDMRPYKVEHFMADSEESPEDIFELVGVLVHSGTAESGHYYSFIRERPSNSDKENWVEFNDDTVTPWDPTCMEGACFGGLDYRGPVDGGNLQYDKSYSAYMLFYQRSSVLAAQKQTLESQEMMSPIRLPIAPRLSNQIAMENEVLMRKYCLYDPSHSAFVVKMLSNIKQINKGQCSQSHTLEKDALTVALNHLDQVVARTKDLPDFPTFMLTIRQICHSCPECSRDFLDWFCDYPDTLRHLLLRNPDVLVRSEIASSILSALVKVKADASYAYGLGDEDDSADDLEGGDPQLIQRVVKSISRLWDIFHSNCRAWPEYFGLLASIANLGTHEAVLLLDEHFLRRTLDIVSADPLLSPTPQYSRMLNIISKRIATRPVSYESVIALLHKLILVVDPAVDPISDHKDRIELFIDGDPVPLAVIERHLLTQHWTRGQAHILVEKLLQIHQNNQATRQILVTLLHWPESMDLYIAQAIVLGIRKGTPVAPCGPFLRAALTYCEESESPRAIMNMVSHVSKVAGHLDNTEGREFLHFLKDILELPTNHNCIPKGQIFQFYLDQVPFWGPGMLTYYDNTVRTETEDFLHEIVLRHGSDVDSGTSAIDAERSNAIVLAAQRLGVACLDFLQETYIRQRQQAVRATLINIQSVIESCSKFFDEENEDHLTTRFVDQRASVLPALKKFTVEEADEEVSGIVDPLSSGSVTPLTSLDWDGSDGEYGSSEPMDSIAELCGTVDADLNDTDLRP